MPAKKRNKKTNTLSQALGAGAGVCGGAATGAALGSLGGPIGTAVGAVVGGVAGGLAGREVADVLDPAEEETYWQGQYPARPYYHQTISFEEYRPAYRQGCEAAGKYPGRCFDEVEALLRRNWAKVRGSSRLSWAKARDAIRDAYERTLRLHEERSRSGTETVEVFAVHKEIVSPHPVRARGTRRR